MNPCSAVGLLFLVALSACAAGTDPGRNRHATAQASAEIAGVGAVQDPGPRWDLVIAIDVSNSTEDPSGADIDQDGRVGKRYIGGPLHGWLMGGDSADSVLAAEVHAVRALLHQLDARTTRVGIVRFAGDGNPSTPDAKVEVFLTSDYAEVEAGLRRILKREPGGMTNMVAAIDASVDELLGKSALTVPGQDLTRVVLLLSDGYPTLPDRLPRKNTELASSSAKRAQSAGILIMTIDLSTESSESRALVEIARLDGGITFHRRAAELGELLADPNFRRELLR